MPRGKYPRRKHPEQQTISLDLHESILKENQMLRRELDKRAEQYNMVSTVQPYSNPKSFLTQESQRQIYSTSDLQSFVSEVFDKGIGIIGRKNYDYGDHKNSDPFGNFRRHGLKGFLVRIDDKIARLNTFCDTGKLAVMDESVLDTIVDAANYLAIMAAYIYSEKVKRESPEVSYSSILNEAGIGAGFGAKSR